MSSVPNTRSKIFAYTHFENVASLSLDRKIVNSPELDNGRTQSLPYWCLFPTGSSKWLRPFEIYREFGRGQPEDSSGAAYRSTVSHKTEKIEAQLVDAFRASWSIGKSGTGGRRWINVGNDPFRIVGKWSRLEALMTPLL